MTVHLKGTGINQLPQCFYGIGITVNHFLGHRLGPTIVAVDVHGDQYGQANNLGNDTLTVFKMLNVCHILRFILMVLKTFL